MDAKNNILIETTVTNYLNNNFDKPHYTMFQNLIAEINMPREIVNAELEIGPYDAALDVAARIPRRVGGETDDDDSDELSDGEAVEWDNDENEDSPLDGLDQKDGS